MPRHTFRFFDDYGSGWLWAGDAATLNAFDVGPLDTLLAPRLSATRAEAKALSAINHASLDRDDPATPLPLDPAHCDDFNRRALALMRAMQAELGPDFLLLDQFHRLTPGQDFPRSPFRATPKGHNRKGPMPTIDLNADLGEDAGDDAAMLALVTSANIACGAHAGSPATLRATLAAAPPLVALGAHPGYADRANFGRLPVPMSDAALEHLITTQIAAACDAAAALGRRITYVKAHGALYNLAAADPAKARTLARAIRAVDPTLAVLTLAASPTHALLQDSGLGTCAEGFADRALLPDGSLMPRGRTGAVLHDPALITARALQMLETGHLPTDPPIPAPLHSLCVHGDTPGAVAIARHLRAALIAAGVTLAPFAPA